MDKLSKTSLFAATFLVLLSVQLVEAFLLMLVLGGVWHETGWLQPVSYAGALVLTWTIYVVKFIWGTNLPKVTKNE